MHHHSVFTGFHLPPCLKMNNAVCMVHLIYAQTDSSRAHLANQSLFTPGISTIPPDTTNCSWSCHSWRPRGLIKLNVVEPRSVPFLVYPFLSLFHAIFRYFNSYWSVYAGSSFKLHIGKSYSILVGCASCIIAGDSISSSTCNVLLY